MIFEEVFYHGIDERYQETEDLANEISEKAIKLAQGEKSQGILIPIIKLAPMLKHPGFNEEKELRLVVLNSVAGHKASNFPRECFPNCVSLTQKSRRFKASAIILPISL